MNAFAAQQLTKTFRDRRTRRTVDALHRVDLAVPRGSLVGLIGRNGSGKSTLLAHVTGDQLPDSGTMTTLGRSARNLGEAELSRMGVVYQRSRFIEWMTVDEHIRYVASFYETWDAGLEQRLVAELELDLDARVGHLSPGNVQKLALVLATGHRPELLLLDEPAAGLDPFGRAELLRFLLDLLREQEETTIVISSHVLRDIERVVDRIVCMHHGEVVADAPLDELQEGYALWQVSSGDGSPLPHRFTESYVRRQVVEGPQAQLWVTPQKGDREAFESRHGVSVRESALALDEIFPLLTGTGSTGAGRRVA